MLTLRDVLFALTPGGAECLKHKAQRATNFALVGTATGMQYARNGFYCGVALTAIAAIGSAKSDDSTTRYACATAATLGAGVVTVAAKFLYDAILEFKEYKKGN